jgi:protein O-mannosyl-transferase
VSRSKSPSGTGASRRRAPIRRRGPTTVLAVALVLAGVWAYAPSFQGVFLLDDVRAIVRNPHIRSLWPPGEALSAPRATTLSGRPVASLSFGLSYALAPADAREAVSPDGRGAPPGAANRFLANVWSYHLGNLLVHLAAGLALFGVVRRTLASERLRGRFEAVAPWLAFATAATWLVHPLTTESVTYVVQRVESLMSLWYLLTLYCAIRAWDDSRQRLWAAGAVVCCALGMGTKEAMVSAPIVVALWDWTFLHRMRPRLYAALVATWAVLIGLLLFAPRAQSVGFGLEGWTARTYALTQTQVLVHYLRLAVVPAPLVFFYAWPMVTSAAAVAPQAAFIGALIAATIVGLARRHPLGFAGAVFFGILAPTSSVVPIVTEVAAEHRMYLPLAVVVACAAAGAYLGVGWLLARLVRRADARRRTGGAIGVALLALLVATLGAQTRVRNRDYSSAEGLWLDAIQKQPANGRAHLGYGMALLEADRDAEAEAQFRAAVRLDERDALAHGSLGTVLVVEGKTDEALPHLMRALELRPDYADAHFYAGEAYADKGEDALAVEHYRRALDGRTDDPVLLAHLAEVLATSSDDAVRNGAEAVRFADRAVQLTSRRDVLSLAVLASAQAEVDRFADAMATLRDAMALATAQSNVPLVTELESRLAAYQAGRKVRQPPH